MYNRKNAVDYAKKWWNRRNPEFYNFDSLGGDCTNFVSQCLYYGGISMNYLPNGWFYTSLSSRAPAWTGVDEFYSFALSNRQISGVRARECTLKEVEVGDVVQMWAVGEDSFHHNMLITEIKGDISLNTVKVTCHTYDRLNFPLINFSFAKLRYLKILN